MVSTNTNITIVSNMPTYWNIRQNPCATTNQKQMRDFILERKMIVCPFGHLSDSRNRVIDEIYNEDNPEWSSRSQDRKFIKDISIGDIVIIPFAGLKTCILAVIKSTPIYAADTGLFTIKRNEQIEFSEEGGIPFRPVVREIEIINPEVEFLDKRILPRTTLSRIKASTIERFI